MKIIGFVFVYLSRQIEKWFKYNIFYQGKKELKVFFVEKRFFKFIQQNKKFLLSSLPRLRCISCSDHILVCAGWSFSGCRVFKHYRFPSKDFIIVSKHCSIF